MSASLRIAAIVLAAGQSKRMGAVNKLLMEVEGVPMIRRVVDAVRGGGVSEIFVVTGFERERIESCLQGSDVEFVFNENFEEGMGASLAAGAKAIGRDCVDGILVCLGDLPSLRAETVAWVVREFREAGGDRIVVPIYKNRRGHPIVFLVRYLSSLECLSGDVGAKELIRRERDCVLEVEVVDEGIIRDLDTIDHSGSSTSDLD